MNRAIVAVCGVLGLTAVALGAFGAHGLERALDGAPDAAARLDHWETAARYHLAHALAVGLAAWIASTGRPRAGRAAALCFTLGVVLFSGSLYALSLTGARWLGAVTPLGGLAFLAGWAAIIVAAARRS